jgi:hypothetical protein
MEPLQPPQNFKFNCIYFQNEPTNIIFFNSNQPPNLVPFPKPLFDVNLWIFVEKTKRKRKEYEQNKCFKMCGMLMWVKIVVDAHGKVLKIKCKVYTIIKKQKINHWPLNTEARW